MGIFSFLAGNSKSVEKVIDAGISGIDKLVFTDEEKAEYHAKLQKLHLQFVQISANESTTQSISRRLICLPVVYFWLFMIFFDVWTQVLGTTYPAIEHAIDSLSTPALAAIGFYVGRHLVSDWNKPKK